MLEVVDFFLDQIFRLPVRKKLNPNDPRDFVKIQDALAKAIQGLTGADEARALREALKQLDVDWKGMHQNERELVVDAARGVVNLSSKVLPRLREFFEANALKLGKTTKGELVRQFGFDSGIDLTRVDRQVLQGVAFSQANFFRDEYGKRSDVFGLKAKQVVAEGLEAGMGRKDLTERLHKELSAQQANRSKAYAGVVAASFTGRSRAYANLSTFEDAGVESFTFDSVLDQRTSAICRFMHGKVFPVAAAKQNFHSTEADPDPENVRFSMPWVREGVDDNGQKALYTREPNGGKNVVAHIDNSGRGVDGSQGAFSNGVSDKALQARGLMVPPLHGFCRSTITPNVGVPSRVSVSVPDAVKPPDLSALPPPKPEDRIEGIPPPPSPGDLRAWADSDEDGMMNREKVFLGKLRIPVPRGEAPLVDRQGVRDAIDRLHDPKLSTKEKIPVVVRYKEKLYIHNAEGNLELFTARKIDQGSAKKISIRILDLDSRLADLEGTSAKTPDALLELLHSRIERYEALRQSGTEAAKREMALLGREVRRGMRDYIQANLPGASSVDVDEKREDRDRYSVWGNGRMGGAAAHHSWKGEMVFSEYHHKGMVEGLQKLKFMSREQRLGIKGHGADYREEHAWFSVQALFHEELHGFSRARSSSYESVGVGIEECQTEITARRLFRQFLGQKGKSDDPSQINNLPSYTRNAQGEVALNLRGHGAYPEFIDSLFRGVATHGRSINTNDLAPRIEAAFDKIITGKKRFSMGQVGDRKEPGHEHIDAFVDALDVPKGEADKIKAHLKDPKNGLSKTKK